MPASVPKRDEGSAEDLDALARRAVDGDERAFEALVRGVHGRIHRWALARLGDPDDADDVTQAVLVRLHRKLDTWRGCGRVTSWLYRVTANECSSWRRRVARRLGRRERLRFEDDDHASSDRGEPAAGGTNAKEVARLVTHYFEALPDRQREVFDLVDLQGYAPAEVSEMLDLNPNTVRANLFKARHSIRARILEDHPHVAEDT